MKMLMFVLLLSGLIITKVESKPTLDNSELANTLSKEELRSKRQATFFDLLHQAIEKYANCADEYLAPLKSLATTHSQYETLIPEKYSPTKKATAAASNQPNIKCTRVNLCSITGANTFSQTKDNNNPAKNVGKIMENKHNVTKLWPYFFANGNDKSRQASAPTRTGDVGKEPYAKYSALKYSHNHNNLYNKNILNFLFNKSTAVSRQQILGSAGPETVLARTASKPNCFCWRNNRMEILANENPKTNDLLQTPHQQETAEDGNAINCLRIINSDAKPSPAAEKILESVADKNLLPNDSTEFDQNLNQLLRQLDEIAETASNGELRDIVEKLKNLKSAFDTKEEPSLVTTSTPTLMGAQVSQHTNNRFGLSNWAVDLLNTIFKTNSATKAATTKRPSFNKGNIVFQNKKSAPSYINEDFPRESLTDRTNSYDSQLLGKELSFFDSDILKDSVELVKENVYETATENLQKDVQGKKFLCSALEPKSQDTLPDLVGNSHTPNLELLNFENLKLSPAEKYASILDNSKTFIDKESLDYSTTSTTILPLNYKNSAHQADTLGSPLESQILRDFYEEILTEQNDKLSKTTHPNQSKQIHVSGKVSEHPVVLRNYENTEDIEDTFSKCQTNSSKLKEKDSKIIISITSNGRFKHVQVEQQMTGDKKWEINEKEKMNMAVTKSKGSSKDMEGTGSRVVHIVKQPQKIDSSSYAEPILSEIYPAAKSKPSSTNSPLSIYWHKIEKQSPKLNGESKGIWQTFRSSDIFDGENSNKKNLATKSKTTLKYKIKGDTKRRTKH